MATNPAPYKTGFIEFLVRCEALRFGTFVTKSGRTTPFFINTGVFDSGARMRRLGQFYAEALTAHFGADFDVLFGPAYKGIPLAVATAMELGTEVGIAFNRKEAKDHGEGGLLVGRRLRDGDRVVIIEDVTTAGTSVRESMALLRAAADVKVVGLLVSVDRQERGTGARSALAELREEFGLRPAAIVTLDEIVAHLHNRPIDGRVVLDDAMLSAIGDYRAKYGCRA
ncbi:MAG: orotate phosphoribosyltransferase [Candidatus Sumerlaeota bacterium]|nr:orotate phosphoribosyltransferase [Candidatus Sumerlaeota bacterium]